MSDEELTRLLSEIQKGAKELNSASDEINSIITSIEKKIVAANVGLECWLESEPLYLSEPYPISLGVQDSGHVWTDTILGFAKLEGEGWRLAIRTRQFIGEDREWDDRDDSSPSPKLFDASPLWRASRTLRIEALKKMPALLQVIRDTIKESLEAIATAKKLVE